MKRTSGDMLHFGAPDRERKCLSIGNSTEGHIAPYHAKRIRITMRPTPHTR